MKQEIKIKLPELSNELIYVPVIDRVGLVLQIEFVPQFLNDLCNELPGHFAECYRNATVGIYGGGASDCNCTRRHFACRKPKLHTEVHEFKDNTVVDFT